MATFYARQSGEGIKVELSLTRADIDLLVDNTRFAGILEDREPRPDKVDDAVAEVIISLVPEG
jgi:hypothetical protein